MRSAFAKYPLTEVAYEHVQTVQVDEGDCVFVPSLYWMQYNVESDNSMHLTFYYEESSKFGNLLYDGLRLGVHKDE